MNIHTYIQFMIQQVYLSWYITKFQVIISDFTWENQGETEKPQSEKSVFHPQLNLHNAWTQVQ